MHACHVRVQQQSAETKISYGYYGRQHLSFRFRIIKPKTLCPIFFVFANELNSTLGNGATMEDIPYLGIAYQAPPIEDDQPFLALDLRSLPNTSS